MGFFFPVKQGSQETARFCFDLLIKAKTPALMFPATESRRSAVSLNPQKRLESLMRIFASFFVLLKGQFYNL